MRKQWKLILALLAVFGMIAAACGGDDDDASSSGSSSDSSSSSSSEDSSSSSSSESSIGLLMIFCIKSRVVIGDCAIRDHKRVVFLGIRERGNKK